MLRLEEGVWTWINVVSGTAVKVYQEGRVRNLIAEAAKFNGSISLVRLYDKVLSRDEINQNITAWAEWRGVDPASKLTTIWGRVKTRY